MNGKQLLGKLKEIPEHILENYDVVHLNDGVFEDTDCISIDFVDKQIKLTFCEEDMERYG